MTIGRRTGAPRLIEWTGERCVPWAPDIQVIYEHLHRYLWAARLVEGRRVLDLASGEGFGASLLARTAESVDGIDVDATTVDHAVLNYGSERIRFALGDAQDLSAYADGSFGAVIAFEMIEHVADQQAVLREAARVLEPDGLLVISTPDRRAYSGGEASENPFHVRELDLSELRTLLGDHFPHHGVWAQRTITGSALSNLGGGDRARPSETFFVEHEGDDWSVADGMSPMYLVAVASRGQLPAIASESTLADADLALLRSAEARVKDIAVEIDNAEQRWREEFTDADRRWRERLADAEERAQDADDHHQHAVRDLHNRNVEIDTLARRLGEVRAAEAALAGELAVERALTARVSGSVTWRAFQAIRWRLFAALGGEHSAAVRVLQLALRGAGAARRGMKRADAARSGREFPRLQFPDFPEPEVSLVIPVYSGADLTFACLRSILENTSRVAYEVIVIDDGDDPDVTSLLAGVTGARVIANETNLGYLRSVNRAAGAARGEWLVLCNNDIEVTPGWLDQLLQCARSEPGAAIVTPMYLAPDGLISEAGAILWRDATGWNVCRGQPSEDFHAGYRRDVDYGSAAALLVDARFWREVGGFDERFAPMYYEDADLAFQARARGRRVVYEPQARVVHAEGSTAGTDPSAGAKRHQEINRATFEAKWRAELAGQPTSSPHHVRRAANRRSGPRVLILDHRLPYHDRDAGSLRMREIVRILGELGRQVIFWPDDLAAHQPYAEGLQRDGVEVWCGAIDISAELTSIAGDVEMVIMSRPHIASRWLDIVRELVPGATIVYDTVDLHWLREARRLADPLQRSDPPRASKAGALREIERALIRATDATLVVTEEERALAESEAPGARIWVAPTVNEVRTAVPGPDARSGVLFVGGFEHTPNIDAAVRLVHGVMPIVWRSLPDVRVTIVGGAAPPAVTALASSRVEIAGWIPELEPLLDRARATVAPILYGAGLKGKVTQSISAGLPVVTTAIGAEGLNATDGLELLVAESDADLAERTITVLTDDVLWQDLSDRGRELAERLCSPAVMESTLRDLLEAAPALREGDSTMRSRLTGVSVRVEIQELPPGHRDGGDRRGEVAPDEVER